MVGSPVGDTVGVATGDTVGLEDGDKLGVALGAALGRRVLEVVLVDDVLSVLVDVVVEVRHPLERAPAVCL